MNYFIDKAASYFRQKQPKMFNTAVIERICIGPSICAVQLSGGMCGISGMGRTHNHSISVRSKSNGPFSPGHYKNQPLSSLFENISDNPYLPFLRTAALNALTLKLFRDNLGAYSKILFSNADPIALTETKSLSHVCIVGAFSSYIKTFESLPVRLSVLELNPHALDSSHKKYYRSFDEAQTIIPDADLLIVTASTIANNTLNEILSYKSDKTITILSGPSCGFTPHIFFEAGINHIGCARVTDPNLVFSLISEGAYPYHLYNNGAEKITITYDRHHD